MGGVSSRTQAGWNQAVVGYNWTMYDSLEAQLMTPASLVQAPFSASPKINRR